jgi:hypothetical protein
MLATRLTRRTSAPPAARWLAVVLAGSVPAGCSLKPVGQTDQQHPTTDVSQLTREDLRDSLAFFEDFYESNIKQAAADINDLSSDNRARKHTLLWQLSMIPACNAAMRQSDSITALIHIWAVSHRMTEYFKKGDGRDLFGEHTFAAVIASEQIERNVERVAERFLRDQFEQAREGVWKYSEENPITGLFAGATIRASPTTGEAETILQSIQRIPMAPWRWLGGVDNTAEAIKGFTVTAERFTETLNDLPEMVSWQTQLMMLELEEHDIFQRFVASADQLSQSSARISDVAEGLPGQLREEVSAVLDDAEARQAELRESVEKVREAADSVDAAFARLTQAADALDRAAPSISEAGRSWQDVATEVAALVAEFSAKEDASPREPATEPPGEGTSFEDVQRTVDTLNETAKELHLLTAEVREMIGSDEVEARLDGLSDRVDAALGQAAEGTRAATDHLAWRLGQLLVLALVLAVIYRLIATRWIRRGP